MADDCFTRLMNPEIKKALFGEREVPEALVRRVVQDLEAIKQNMDNGNIDMKTYKSRVQEYIADQKQLTEAQVIMRAENLRKTRENMSFLSQPGFAKDPAEGFKAMISKTTTLANKANQSISAMAGARLEKWGNYMTAELTRNGDMPIFLSGQLDKEIYQATEALSKGLAPDPKLPAEAVRMGKVVNDLNRLLYKDMRDAGIPVRNLEGRVTRQNHEIGKVREAGFDNWWAETLPKLNQSRTFGALAGDMQAMTQAGRNIYSKIVSGRYGLDDVIGNAEVGDFLALGGEKSLADRMSEARNLHFSDSSGAYEYNQKFGKGNLAIDVYQEMRRNARSVAMFERLGDKPRASLEANIERMQSKLRSEGNQAGAERLASQKDRIMAQFDQVSGTLSIPGSQSLAKIGNAIGTLETLSKLWNIGIRSAANVAGAVVEFKNSSGQNIMESTAGMLKSWLSEFPESAKQTWASEGHEFLTDMQHMMINETDQGLVESGGQKAARFMLKYNGQDFMNNAAKNAFALLTQRTWAKQAGKSFAELEPRMQAALLNGGIDKHDWKVLSKAIETDERGRTLITPEAIQNLSDQDVRAALADRGGRRQAPEKYRNDLELRVRAYLIQAGDLVTTTAGAREQSRLNLGTQRGTVEGEMTRLLTRFKSFTLQSMNIAKKFMNSNPNTDQLEKGILMSQGKDMQSLAEWVVMGSVIAYGGDTLIRAMDGKGAKNPKDPMTWLDSMAKSGAGGTYVDFFNGEWDKYNFLGNVFGPTASTVGQAAVATSQVLKGNSGDAINTSTKMLRSYIPFQQAIGVKQGLDYLQYNVVNEALNPGSTERHKLSQTRKQMRGEQQ
jgi:hypothetical protein